MVRLDTSLETLLARAPTNGSGAVLATVVSTAGSTYRKPGARMLILGDGGYVGLLSGGCLEADLELHAREVLGNGRSRAVEYDMRGPDDILFGIGAGCEGAMRVLLEPAGPGTLAAAALARAGRCSQSGKASALIAVHDAAGCMLGTYDPDTLAATAGSGALEGTAPVLLRAAERAVLETESQQLEFEAAGRSARAFVQFLAPPPHVVVCGAGPDAQPVVGAALQLGWRVSVVDHRPAYAVAGRFPGAHVTCADARDLHASVRLDECHAAVVMSHHLPSDAAYLKVLAQGGPGYVGLLGPAARRRRIAEELGEAMLALRPRLRGPVGIDIGASTPESIALSIVCQIHQWLAVGKTL